MMEGSLCNPCGNTSQSATLSVNLKHSKGTDCKSECSCMTSIKIQPHSGKGEKIDEHFGISSSWKSSYVFLGWWSCATQKEGTCTLTELPPNSRPSVTPNTRRNCKLHNNVWHIQIRRLRLPVVAQRKSSGWLLSVGTFTVESRASGWPICSL